MNCLFQRHQKTFNLYLELIEDRSVAEIMRSFLTLFQEIKMNSIIYLVGLVVVVMAVLSLLGLH